MRRKIFGFFIVLVCVFGIGTASVYAVTGSEIVNDLINNYVGKYPYVYGTHGPNSFDCSGLVYYVYSQHGIYLSATTDTDWTQYGTVITDTSKLKDGDILLFGESWSNLHHMGVYDSNGGYIIQALNETKGIIRNPTLSTWINSPGWNSYGWNNFQYAVRVINGGNDTEPPSNVTISCDTTTAQVGDTVTLKYTIDRAWNAAYIVLYYNNEDHIIYVNGSPGSIQYTFKEAGKYYIYTKGSNDAGTTDCNGIWITVTEAKPSNITIDANKRNYVVGELARLYYTIDNATNSNIVLYYNSVDHFIPISGSSGSKDYIFTSPSKHYVYTKGTNNAGTADCNGINIYVTETPQPVKTIEYNNSVYYIYDTNFPRATAVDFCAKMGGHLAVIDSATKNSYIQKVISQCSSKSYMIDGSDAAKEGVWKFNTGETISYTNWNGSEPNNANNNENYIEIVAETGKWDDINDKGYITRGFICEVEKNPTTSTTATRTNGAIEVQTTISNLTESATCVKALYSADGTLLGQSATDVDSRTNSTTAYFPNYPNASYVKVFLWDSLEGMCPLTNGEKIGEIK